MKRKKEKLKILYNKPIDNAKITTDKTLTQKYSWYLIILICIISLYIRLYRLDYQALWVDEYMHADAARTFLFENGKIWGIELNQMVINILNCIFTWCFGYNDFVLRLPVALLSIIGIPAIYLLGKKLFSNSVGLISAILFAFSQYLIFWSRIDRAYGLIPSIYLWVLYFFWNTIELYNNQLKQNVFFHKIQINLKYFIYFLLTFIVAFCTQIQVLLIIFSVGFYCTFVWINNLANKNLKSKFSNKYAIITYLNIIATIIILTPSSEIILRPFIKTFLNDRMADFILPKWGQIFASFKSKEWNNNFITYTDVTKYDLNYFFYIGWAGFILAFFKNKKVAFFLISTFIIPILIMGFILREPNLGKYMSFYYPVFILSGAITFKIIYEFIKEKFIINLYSKYLKTYNTISIIAIIVIMCFIIPINKIKTFINTEEQIYIFDEHLSEIQFPTWKKNLEYIFNNFKEGDIILSTIPSPIIHYAKVNGKENVKVFQFRQQQINFKEMKWELIPLTEEMKNQDNAFSYEGLQKLFNKYNRAWLIGDYYLDKNTTNTKCLEFVFKNMDYHLNANDDGDIKIFSWDKSKPKQEITPILITLGKKYEIKEYDPLIYKITSDMIQKINNSNLDVYVNITYEGIDSPKDAVLVINKKNSIYIDVKPIYSNINGVNILKTNSGISTIKIKIDKKWLIPGDNELKILNGEPNNGFVIYNAILIL